MIHVALTPEMLERAKALYPFDALRNSITEGRSNIYGAIGEIVFGDLYSEWTRDSCPDWDYRHPQHGTVDVKTKRTTATPQPHWYCSVAATSLHQRCRYLYFVRVNEALTDAWLLGWIPADELTERGVFGRKGEDDGTGWVFKADCWNVRVDALNVPSPVVVEDEDRCTTCNGWVAGAARWTEWCGCPFE